MNQNQSKQLERIVAYLDGELSPEEGAQIEQQLATDQQFRQQLQGAERAWAALDQLPRATVGDEFSRTTMELVVDAARQDVAARTIALPVQRRKRSLRTALLATMALLFGALVVRVGWQNPNRRLIADLPVIQNIDIYSQFHSVDFLQQLHRHLGDDPLSPTDAEPLQAKLAEFQKVASTPDRQAWLQHLPADTKLALRTKYNRFRNLSTEGQAQLRQLHQQIQSDANSSQLLETLFRYQQWLAQVPPSEQFQLRELSASERARQVAREIKRPLADQRFELTPKQLRDLKKAVQPMFEEIFEQRLSKKSPRNKKRIESMSDRERLRELFFALRESPEKMDRLNDLLVDALPANVREEFKTLPRWERGPVVVRWLRQARAQEVNARRAGKRLRPGEFPEQELADFFVEELDPAQKEQLLALPRDQMQQQLQRLYRGERSHRPEYNDGPPPRHGPPRHGSPPPHDRRPAHGPRGPRDEFRRPPPYGRRALDRRPMPRRDFNRLPAESTDP